MTWLAVFKLLLELAAYAANHVTEEQLKQEGQARAVTEILKRIDTRLGRARAARDSVARVPADELRNQDPTHRRD